MKTCLGISCKIDEFPNQHFEVVIFNPQNSLVLILQRKYKDKSLNMKIILRKKMTPESSLLSTGKCKIINFSEENILRGVEIEFFTGSSVDFILNFSNESVRKD